MCVFVVMEDRVKVFIDAMGATSYSGGMRLYAEEVISSWAEFHPKDRLTVLAGTWATQQFFEFPNVTVVTWDNESTFMRAVGQFIVSAVRFRSSRSEVLLSISPIVTPLVSRRRRICVVHDWRHLKNQDQFGFFQKQYRRLWVFSVNRAGAAVSISEKTKNETASYATASHGVLVENGRDNARRWQAAHASLGQDGEKCLVTFGHQSNKRPELVIQGFAKFMKDCDAQTRLTVLGATGDYARSLAGLASSLGVKDQCDFPGFVNEIAYQSTIRKSSVVILASSDEGFGLPVAEAQYFGIPIVVASDSGLDAIHEGLIVAEPTVYGLASAFGVALAVEHKTAMRSSVRTWEQVVLELRGISTELISHVGHR